MTYYYRLNVIPVIIPPLRERKEDIPDLMFHLLQRAEQKYGVSIKSLPNELMQKLMDYSWPGNVRELANVIERLVLLAEDGLCDSRHLELRQTESQPVGLPEEGINWEEMEQRYLSEAMIMAKGNRSKAAKLLQLPYKAFLYRLEKYNIE